MVLILFIVTSYTYLFTFNSEHLFLYYEVLGICNHAISVCSARPVRGLLEKAFQEGQEELRGEVGGTHAAELFYYL